MSVHVIQVSMVLEWDKQLLPPEKSGFTTRKDGRQWLVQVRATIVDELGRVLKVGRWYDTGYEGVRAAVTSARYEGRDMLLEYSDKRAFRRV